MAGRKAKECAAPDSKDGQTKRFNTVTFHVVWEASHKRYEVRGDDGRCHASSADRQAAIDTAVRKAARAAGLGMSGLVCGEQEDGSFKVEWAS